MNCYRKKKENLLGASKDNNQSTYEYAKSELATESNLSILEQSINTDLSFVDANEDLNQSTSQNQVPNQVNVTMAMTNIEFVKLVSSQINRNFNGVPLTLQSF